MSKVDAKFNLHVSPGASFILLKWYKSTFKALRKVNTKYLLVELFCVCWDRSYLCPLNAKLCLMKSFEVVSLELYSCGWVWSNWLFVIRRRWMMLGKKTNEYQYEMAQTKLKGLMVQEAAAVALKWLSISWEWLSLCAFVLLIWMASCSMCGLK